MRVEAGGHLPLPAGPTLPLPLVLYQILSTKCGRLNHILLSRYCVPGTVLTVLPGVFGAFQNQGRSF